MALMIMQIYNWRVHQCELKVSRSNGMARALITSFFGSSVMVNATSIQKMLRKLHIPFRDFTVDENENYCMNLFGNYQKIDHYVALGYILLEDLGKLADPIEVVSPTTPLEDTCVLLVPPSLCTVTVTIAEMSGAIRALHAAAGNTIWRQELPEIAIQSSLDMLRIPVYNHIVWEEQSSGYKITIEADKNELLLSYLHLGSILVEGERALKEAEQNSHVAALRNIAMFGRVDMLEAREKIDALIRLQDMLAEVLGEVLISEGADSPRAPDVGPGSSPLAAVPALFSPISAVAPTFPESPRSVSSHGDSIPDVAAPPIAPLFGKGVERLRAYSIESTTGCCFFAKPKHYRSVVDVLRQVDEGRIHTLEDLQCSLQSIRGPGRSLKQCIDFIDGLLGQHQMVVTS